MNLSTLNRANISVNQLIPAKRSVEYRIEADELLPVQVQCNIHPWMKGWILVKDTPYATITDSDGKFVIDKIPAGKWKFRFWHEEIGWIQKVAINGEEQKWRRGEVELVIADQQVLDLGKIEVGLKK